MMQPESDFRSAVFEISVYGAYMHVSWVSMWEDLSESDQRGLVPSTYAIIVRNADPLENTGGLDRVFPRLGGREAVRRALRPA